MTKLIGDSHSRRASVAERTNEVVHRSRAPAGAMLDGWRVHCATTRAQTQHERRLRKVRSAIEESSGREHSRVRRLRSEEAWAWRHPRKRRGVRRGDRRNRRWHWSRQGRGCWSRRWLRDWRRNWLISSWRWKRASCRIACGWNPCMVRESSTGQIDQCCWWQAMRDRWRRCLNGRDERWTAQ